MQILPGVEWPAAAAVTGESPASGPLVWFRAMTALRDAVMHDGAVRTERGGEQ